MVVSVTLDAIPQPPLIGRRTSHSTDAALSALASPDRATGLVAWGGINAAVIDVLLCDSSLV
jgi:hypothetical protein